MNEQSNGWPASGISGFVQGSNTQLNAGLVMSMISRSSGVAQTGLGLAPRSVGYAWWYEMVKDGARWDFKDQIKAELGSSAMYCDSESCDWYEYSTSGNIFYAYIGRVLGFSEFELRSGAVVAQQGDPENDPIANTWYGLDQASDQAAIELGFMIYNMIGRSPSEEGMMMAFKNLLKIRKSGLQHISEPTSSYRAPFPLGVNGPEFPLSYFDGTNGIGSLGRE